MRENENEFSIEKMAKVLNVSRSGYYEFLSRGKSARSIENERLKTKIKSIHEKSHKVYGSPRVHQELKKQGEKSASIQNSASSTLASVTTILNVPDGSKQILQDLLIAPTFINMCSIILLDILILQGKIYLDFSAESGRY